MPVVKDKINRAVHIIRSQSYHLDRGRVFLLIRYLFAGGLSFTTNVGLLYIFETYFNWWYIASSTLAFVIAVVVSFLAQKYITFQDKSKDEISIQILQYVIIAFVNIIANGVMVFVMVEYIHLTPVIAQVISAGFIAVWSLLVYRFIIFNQKIEV
ncbi:hypothetical protein COW81_03350 [Candidatus Campbellbacteria bacterium CG22_combo_CG10-13_8_21_14_all_36_13]|uniref:GtrA/DPMS transmembrane domain-containing protein n=1 Tax=Candidatus Campbellbacteria bacterium CG22_combo_CG10-13_8_21_14_all_36_13 TaxID=1974529 RepID=A0A2H0DXH3_9BACT|nr:MAG: hypothetical protein COW81_03350 [Candidatus Campbellbacteria bacterium CG22_combo_CG10-13_8_21_14_all_36_13]